MVGSADGTGFLAGSIQGFEASAIDVSANSAILGLAQLSNKATAAATSGVSSSSTAIAFAQNLEGVSFDGLEAGGVASLAGQASLVNSSKATNVAGAAAATSELVTASGLEAKTYGVPSGSGIGIDVASDATITGLGSISSSATAATTAGLAKANSIGGSIQGIQLEDARIGGVASITGQTNFSGSAKSTNVTDGNSKADSSLFTAGGFDSNELVDISSDATLKGLSSVNMSALAESTGAKNAPTQAHAGFDADYITGAAFERVQIGGLGTITGQAAVTGAAQASNVSGDADATGYLGSVTGLETRLGLNVSSDGAIKGIASETSSTTAASTAAGDATASNLGFSLKGADLGYTTNTIGGVGDILGQVGFTGASTATNVSGAAGSSAYVAIADGLTTHNLTDIKSDGTLRGIATTTNNAAAETTTGNAGSGAIADHVHGAQLDEVSIGGSGTVLGQASITSAAQANSVTGNAVAAGVSNRATGLDTQDYLTVSSDASLIGNASVTGWATAATTAGYAQAQAIGREINGVIFGDLDEIGGIGSIQGAANFNLNAKSTNVTSAAAGQYSSDALAGYGYVVRAVGLDSTNGIGIGSGINIASDASLSGTTIGSLKADPAAPPALPMPFWVQTPTSLVPKSTISTSVVLPISLVLPNSAASAPPVPLMVHQQPLVVLLRLV